MGTLWADHVLNWAATDRATAFGNPGQATISASLYSLVKYAEVTPKSFVCKGESSRKVFKASDYLTNYEDEDVWDFGPFAPTQGRYPSNHCSYSYHMPYNKNFLSTASTEPGAAVAADRNPFLDPFTRSDNFVWNNYNVGTDGIKGYQYGNSGAHQREGQNVLFMDFHVDFEKESFCGIDEDNIYTYWSPSAPPIQQGMPPQCDNYDVTNPVNRNDSLLGNECGEETVITPPPGPGPGPPPPPPPPPIP